MLSCLGIHVQKNLIKYAKVSKQHNITKVEAYGIKFYEDSIESAIEQIVKETSSYQTPISINLDKEQYTYENIFKLLKPQDIEKSADTEFDFFCNNNNKNRNTLEYRKIQTVNLEDRDRVRIIYAYTDKTNVVEKIQQFEKYKIHSIVPTAVSLPNLNIMSMQDNSLIVNIEQKTELTTVVNGQIYKVDKIEQGMNNILNIIAERENSIQKAYEICKNTTVYTKTGQNVTIEGNEYLDDVIVAIMEIIDQIKKVIINNGIEIKNIYLTGIGVLINNIDLLFQENFIDKKCEILVPSLIERTNTRVNIKDYVEINSALSLALQGVETRKQAMNFHTSSATAKKIWDFLNQDMKASRIKQQKPKTKVSLKEVINRDIDISERMLLRTMTAVMLLIILYTASAYVINKQLTEKIEEANIRIDENKSEISSIENLKLRIDTRTAKYQDLIDKIDEANSEITETYSSKNAIPNLLNRIMYNIPQGVQLLSIENGSGKKITIEAQSQKYDQLGYFKAVLEEEGILTNVTTSKGVKEADMINITITGELPY